ncbi:MAG: type II secretion system F family protein [Candidatus Omnitrophota bacterium]
MAKFICTTISKASKKNKAITEAKSEEALLEKLQSQGLTVISIVPYQEGIRVTNPEEAKLEAVKFRAKPVKTHRRVRLTDLVLFARQLATMLSAGVTLLRSLEVISVQLQSQKLIRTMAKVKKDVESGRNFSDSLAEYPDVFSKLWVNLIQAGEASGNLNTVLERLADYIEARAEFKSKITTAMIYPLILLVVATAAILVFTIIIIPKFTSIFQTFDIELPLITKVLIGLSNFLRHGIIFLILGVMVLIALFKNFIKTKDGKRIYDRFKLQMPLLGEFIQSVQVEGFASEISMLLESGVPILYGLEITQQSMENSLMEEAVGEIKDSVRAGQPLHTPMEESGLFSPMVSQLIAIGEEIGELPKMCKQIAIYYQNYIKTFVTRFTAMLEPLMIVFMGIIVGVMVIAMYLPIFQMSTGGSF